MNTRGAVVVLAVAAAIAASACSDPVATSTTAPGQMPTDLPTLEFGNGELPVTVPSDFPIPEPSAIATTMIDRSRDLTEVVFNVGATVDDVVAFYTVNLPRLGYEITGPSKINGESVIAFVGNGIDGDVTLKAAGPGLTSAILVFVDI